MSFSYLILPVGCFIFLILGFLAVRIASKGGIRRIQELEQKIKSKNKENHHLNEELKRLKENLPKSPLCDSVTGLYTPEALNKLLEGEIRRAVRYGSPLTLMVISLEELVSIEEDYGRNTVDYVAKGVADLLRESIRAHDIPAMISPSEFLILCPNTGGGNVRNYIERLELLCESLVFSPLPPLMPRFGVALWKKGDTPASLIHRSREDLQFQRSQESPIRLD